MRVFSRYVINPFPYFVVRCRFNLPTTSLNQRGDENWQKEKRCALCREHKGIVLIDCYDIPSILNALKVKVAIHLVDSEVLKDRVDSDGIGNI
jgi:hypothetical protein